MADPEDRRLRLPLRQQHRAARSTSRRSRLGRELPNVVVSREYKYMCSDPGQDLIKKDIKKLGLNRVVVASCSPLMHEPTFRKAVGRRRPQPVPASRWPTSASTAPGSPRTRTRPPRRPRHPERAVHRPAVHQALDPIEVPVNPAVMVVGGGIAGIEAALEIADDRQEGLPGREGAEHRRPHGHVRQDLPDARLRRLHPDAQDGGGRQAPEHHADDLLRGRGGRRLRRQLQGQGPQEGPLRRHRQVHRLRRLHGRMRACARCRASSTRGSASGRRSTARSRRPCRCARPSTRRTASRSRARSASSPAPRRAAPRPSTTSSRTRSWTSKSARSSWPPASSSWTRTQARATATAGWRTSSPASSSSGSTTPPAPPAGEIVPRTARRPAVAVMHCVGSRD